MRRAETLCVGTLRGKPARQSLASSRNQVLRGLGATRAAKLYTGSARRRLSSLETKQSWESVLSAETPTAPGRRNAWRHGPTGVEEHGYGAWGFPRNVGGPVVSVLSPVGVPVNRPWPSAPRPCPRERRRSAGTGPPSEGNEARREERRGFAATHRPRRQGHSHQGTLRREGEDGSMEPSEGKTTGTQPPGTVSTKLARIAKLAREGPEMALPNLAHHVDVGVASRGLRAHPPSSEQRGSTDRQRPSTRRVSTRTCDRCSTVSSPAPIGRRRSSGCTSQRATVKRGRSGFRPWRTKSSNGRWRCSWGRSTSRTFSTVRMASDRGGERIRRSTRSAKRSCR